MGIILRGKWYHYYKTIEKKRYTVPLKIKKGQEHLLSERLKQVESEVIAKHFNLEYTPVGNISLEEYIDVYLKSKGHKKSIDKDRQRLKKIVEILGNVRLSLIGKREVKELERKLFDVRIGNSGKRLSTTTVNRYFEILRHMLFQAIEDGYLQENPVKKYYEPFIEEPKRRALTADEMVQILRASKDIQDHPRSVFQRHFYDIVLFGYCTGWRLSEILNLKKSYIRDGIAYIPVSETKSRRRIRGNQRKAPPPRVLDPRALKIIEEQNSRSDYVFPLHRRDEGVVYWSVMRVRELTGIKDFTFHMLRHTYATHFGELTDPVTVKAMLGHADVKTTMRYSHSIIEKQRESVTKMSHRINSILSQVVDSKEGV